MSPVIGSDAPGRTALDREPTWSDTVSKIKPELFQTAYAPFDSFESSAANDAMENVESEEQNDIRHPWHWPRDGAAFRM
jgi:hypothetical protein